MHSKIQTLLKPKKAEELKNSDTLVEIKMKIGNNIEFIKYGHDDDISSIIHNLAEKNSKLLSDINYRFEPRYGG